jgi:hypothetical protein
MTPFIPFLIVTSFYEVIIERMEYDDTFHTLVIEVTMTRGMKDVIVFHPLNKYFIE